MLLAHGYEASCQQGGLILVELPYPPWSQMTIWVYSVLGCDYEEMGVAPSLSYFRGPLGHAHVLRASAGALERQAETCRCFQGYLPVPSTEHVSGGH